MSSKSWRDEVVAYIRAEAQPADKFGHQPRLYALTRLVGQGMDYDDDVVFAAAWMHDLGVFLGHRPEDPAQLSRWDHVPYTIARTRELLLAWGFPAAKIDGVAEAIRTHQPKDDPRIPEAVILRDADILEQLGAVGALRALVKVGRDTRYPDYSAVIPVLRKAVDHLPQLLRLPTAQALAVARVKALRDFLEAINAEAGDLLY